LLCLFFLAAFSCVKLPNEIMKDLVTLENFFTKAKVVKDAHFQDFQDMSVECALCGIAVNEVEGLMAENITESEIESFLDSNICTLLSGEMQTLCDDLVAQLPNIIKMLWEKQSVSVVCVEIGICSIPFKQYPDWTSVPVYTVNLDEDPETRWDSICSNPQYGQIVQYLISQVSKILPDNGYSIEKIGEIFAMYIPKEYQQEINGCASQMGVPFGWLALMNLGYELSDACTSVVAQRMDNKIIHGRNMDFWEGMGFTNCLRNATIHVKFTKGGKIFYEMASFAGFVGILSGFKNNAFSVTVDTRFYPQGLTDLFYEVIVALSEHNASLVSFLARDTFAKETTYQGAVNRLSNTPLIADVYYIIAGVSASQGAVISRNRTMARDFWQLNVAKGRWFEVETNYDHWKEAPWFDDRIAYANKIMNAFGRNSISLSNFQTLLQTKPIKNIQTTYTILSCPAENYFTVHKRFCSYPCVE